ncbi:DinB family protein [Pedobacter frigoris]|uniref:DinB family protein n=1 Tax=Pedobacter frigoris TaxID=2571272 RepID=UPI00292F13E3|nr:DinB family protein [Pedobacter frigoris]
MSAAKEYRRIKHTIDSYESRLQDIGEEVFQKTPSIGGWSYSEVYFHIFDASILALQTIEECIEGKGEVKPTAFIVKMILFFGSLPPGKKYKAPKRLAERLRKIDKNEALILIKQFRKELDEAHPKISKANKNIKTRHPRMGYLNAFQWLRFMEIHLNHHLKQLMRIDKSF